MVTFMVRPCLRNAECFVISTGSRDFIPIRYRYYNNRVSFTPCFRQGVHRWTLHDQPRPVSLRSVLALSSSRKLERVIREDINRFLEFNSHPHEQGTGHPSSNSERAEEPAKAIATVGRDKHKVPSGSMAIWNWRRP